MGTHFKSLIVSWICVLCFNTSNVIFGGRLELLLRYLFALKVIFYTSRKIQLYSCWNLCLCWNVRATIINTSFIYDCFKQFLVFCQYKEYYIWFNFKVRFHLAFFSALTCFVCKFLTGNGKDSFTSKSLLVLACSCAVCFRQRVDGYETRILHCWL